jgi:hypothetical protein
MLRVVELANFVSPYQQTRAVEMKQEKDTNDGKLLMCVRVSDGSS